MAGDSLPKRIEVATYSGYKANERPIYFDLENRRMKVQEIINRWYGPDDDYFKILADDGKVYVLKWRRTLDQWFIQPLTRYGKSNCN